MFSNPPRVPRRRCGPAGAIALLGLAAALALAWAVDVRLYGHENGFFVLRGQSSLVEITDDLYPEDASRLLFGLDRMTPQEDLEAGIRAKWEDEDGSGYVLTADAAGRKWVANFSRFRDERGQSPRGLFLGGGGPYLTTAPSHHAMNRTGMAVLEGGEWLHVWCNANEVLAPASDPSRVVRPTEWAFLGSGTVSRTPSEVVLWSAHHLFLDAVPLHVERLASFRAGDSYFLLGVRLSNRGSRTLHYYYVYGDEPWLGDYGSSQGDVGWVQEGLVPFAVDVDPATHSFAGMFDYGNDLAGELHRYTRAANFLEWLPGTRPTTVYFANGLAESDPASGRPTPLSSPDSRILNLEWGPEALAPGQSRTYLLAIGAAALDPRTGFPVKPAVEVPENFADALEFFRAGPSRKVAGLPTPSPEGPSTFGM